MTLEQLTAKTYKKLKDQDFGGGEGRQLAIQVEMCIRDRSNVGKSSTINKILNRRNFARVGGQPGKTIHINFFSIDKQAYFVAVSYTHLHPFTRTSAAARSSI